MKLIWFATPVPALLLMFAPSTPAQSATKAITPTIEVTVSDSQNNPLAGATVALETSATSQSRAGTTNSEGKCRFEELLSGEYTLRVKMVGYLDAARGPVHLVEKQVTFMHLQLKRVGDPTSKNTAATSVEYSDEPQFTVSGVTDPTSMGGHGSDNIQRTTEALAKDTVHLDTGAPARSNPAASSPAESAERHAELAEVAEREGRPLEAVREYQRAAEMDPSESNLFAWGAELLLHRALVPASEVFTKGQRLFPKSVRMLVGLGVTSYALGSSEEGIRDLLEASDLDPSNATPYLFLGKIQDDEKTEAPGMLERFKRFVSLQADNPLAYLYYAVCLANQSTGSANAEQIESLLLRAVELDPHLGDAYLQLGIFYTRQEEFPKAISAYRKAIENTPLPAEAHYRLAQAYRKIGDEQKSQRELELFDQISQQKTSQAERERHEIGQFVYTLRGQPAQAPASNPH
jgi:tetratricopeptide (TPR) repeat protein